MTLELKAPNIRAIMRTLIPVGTAALAFVFVGILLAAGGFDVVEAYGTLFSGAFGSPRGIGDTFVKTISLLFTGLAVAFAFKCKVWNIGAEGQLYIGATGAVTVALSAAGHIPVLGVVVVVIAGMIFGGGWALIPAFLRTKLGVNEIIVTVMMNFIAILLVDYLLHTILKAPGFLPYTEIIPAAAELPILFEGTRLHAGLIVGIAVTILVYLFLWKTNIGFALRAVGENPKASRYAGMSVSKGILISLGISGAIAGIGGAALVQGVNHQLIGGISPGYGFIGIIIALLGRQHPLGVAVVAFLFAALMSGADVMYRTLTIPATVAQTLQASVLIFALIGEFLARWKFKGVKV